MDELGDRYFQGGLPRLEGRDRGLVPALRPGPLLGLLYLAVPLLASALPERLLLFLLLSLAPFCSARWTRSASAYCGAVHRMLQAPNGLWTGARRRYGTTLAANTHRKNSPTGTCGPASHRFPENFAWPSTTARAPSTVCRRAHGTVPSHGARTRSLNHTEDTPSPNIRSVRPAMSSVVSGETWASKAVFHPPPGSLASTLARHASSGPRTSSSA
ncbi:hypothetical protein ACIQVS_38465 [Streptomyces vinaceus]|uniref:hypothetical protein n=1 Tax=Streptomyces vinaceus TaxID=1960 RepID=UPI003823FDEE